MASTAKVLGVTAIIVVGVGLIAGGITWAVLATRGSDVPPPELIPLEWWQHCTLYQIYPRSFKDSDGDGIGDLKGIISELPLFVEAGVDAIWMSPIFESPMVDFGYDISNFYNIHYEYGTMEDFRELLKKAHELGIKVLLDFVPNHASNESEYFINSEARVPGYEDFFVWADGIDDPNDPTNKLPPSNWVSQFGGSAWEWSQRRQQFYLHQFAIQQADFNFRNQAVRDEMFKIMKFWLDEGADGFRVDALPYLIEADPADHNGRYPDDPLSGRTEFESHQLGYTIPLYTKDLIELYDVVYEWRSFVDRYLEESGGDTRVLFSEGYANVSMTMLYYGNEQGSVGAHFPFNFDFITDLSSKSTARDFVYVILKWLTYMPYGGVPNWVFGNHDNNRMPTRFRESMVDGLNSLNMLLPGVAVTYQGEEIGMKDGYVSWEDTVDVEAINRGDNETYMLYSRDPARTPYHWNNLTNAGFSTAEKTWLPVAEDYPVLNLALQKAAERSHFKIQIPTHFWRGHVYYEYLRRMAYSEIEYQPGIARIWFSFSGTDPPDLVIGYGIQCIKRTQVTNLPSMVYQALTDLRRKERSLSHGDYSIRALSDSTFYLVRFLPSHDTIVLVFNVAETSDTVDLSRIPNLSLPSTVYVSSVHSTRLSGTNISDKHLTLTAGEAIVFKSKPI